MLRGPGWGFWVFVRVSADLKPRQEIWMWNQTT